MSRVSRILADSLSEVEYSILQKISQTSANTDFFNPAVIDDLRDLRLIDFSSDTGCPCISALGGLVLCDRVVNRHSSNGPPIDGKVA